MAVYSNMCRLCRSENNVTLHIFKEKLFEIINTVLPTKVAENDDLPNHICDECGTKLNMISEFRDTVRKADFQFQSLISTKFNKNDSLNICGGSKVRSSSEDVLQNLMQLKSLSVKKVAGAVTRRKAAQRRNSPVYDKSIKAPFDFITKLSKSEVIIKKIRSNNSEDIKDTYITVNNICNYNYNNFATITNEPESESNPENVLDDTDDDFEQELPTSQSPNKTPKLIQDINNLGKQKVKFKMASKRDIPVVEIKTTSIYVCMSCQGRFSSYSELKEHMQTNEVCKNVKLTCETCEKVVKDRKAMYQHSLTHKEKQKYICEECGKTYTNIFSMENHKAIMHGDKEELTGSVYKCKVCNETFIKRKDLFLHVNKHTKEQVHLCDTCGKCFSTEDNLRSHLRTHSDIRPYACESCDKQFRTRLALVQHSHRHTGIKPFVCDVCGKTFAKKCSLTSHVRLHSGQVIVYQCHICLEQFSSNGKLKTHIKFHPA